MRATFSARRSTATWRASPAASSSCAARRAIAQATAFAAVRSWSRARAGDYAGSRIIAGTLIVLGGAGRLPGYLMRRGTIVLGSAATLSPTFVDCGAHNLVFARVFSRLLRPDSKGAADLLDKRLRRFGGDTAVLGKGEIFFPA